MALRLAVLSRSKGPVAPASISGVAMGSVIITPGPVITNRATCVDNGVTGRTATMFICGSLKRLMLTSGTPRFPVTVDNLGRPNVCFIGIITTSNGACGNGLVMGGWHTDRYESGLT